MPYLTTSPGSVRLSGASKVFCEEWLTGSRYALRDLLFRRPPALRRGEFRAIHDLSLTIGAGERIAVTGPSSSGKSTLLALIAGLYPPDAGRVTVCGSVAFGGRSAGGMKTTLTVGENASFLAALCRSDAREALRFAGLTADVDQCLRDIDPIKARRLPLSAVLHSAADILVIDGLSSARDDEFREACIRRILSLPDHKTVLLSDDNEETLDVLCSKLLVLDRGHLVHYGDKSEALLYGDALYEPAVVRRPSADDPEEDDLYANSSEAEIVDAEPALRGHLYDVHIDGARQNYRATCLLAAAGKTLLVETGFLALQSFESDGCECRLYAPFHRIPLAARSLPGTHRFVSGRRYRFSFTLTVPDLQQGVYGLALTLPKGRLPLTHKDVYKVMRIGVLNPIACGRSLSLDVRGSVIEEVA